MLILNYIYRCFRALVAHIERDIPLPGMNVHFMPSRKLTQSLLAITFVEERVQNRREKKNQRGGYNVHNDNNNSFSGFNDGRYNNGGYNGGYNNGGYDSYNHGGYNTGGSQNHLYSFAPPYLFPQERMWGPWR